MHLAWNGTKKRTRLLGRHLKGFNIVWKKGQATVSSRITNHSEMWIDLIVTNRKDLVKQKGTCPLGISDHDMIYATLSTSIPRDPPKIIWLPSGTSTNLRKETFKVTLPVRLFKSAKFLMIPLMFIRYGTCSSQNYATNTHHLNKLKYAVTACLG